ncbi:DUF4402 domain-containing protein [Cetobacterium sp.]|uniref:DUF4402 domain-containing protein n=1 Tax=Cetobacterium sp. TaxID=2071632 RepID=UPI003F3B875E
MRYFFLFLIISLNLYCIDNNNKKEMNITAKVIDPLRVVHDGDINFGNIFQGSNNTSSRHRFTVYGEKGENIKVSLNGNNIHSGKNNFVPIKHNSSSDILTVGLINLSDYNNSTKLDANGEFHYDFDVELKVPKDAVLGPYSGTLTMSVLFQ